MSFWNPTEENKVFKRPCEKYAQSQWIHLPILLRKDKETWNHFAITLPGPQHVKKGTSMLKNKHIPSFQITT